LKLLYLVEGEHDEVFIRHILTRESFPKNRSIKTFKNDGKVNQKRREEQKVIASFLQDGSPYDVLIKVENGKNFVISLMNNVCINIPENYKNVRLVVVFDHDGKKPSDEFNEIANVIKSSKPVDFIIDGERNKMGIAHSSRYKLVKNPIKTHNLSEVYFFCFYKSLECEVKKKYGTPVDHCKIKKLGDSFKPSDIWYP
jgi:hypothetical protein